MKRNSHIRIAILGGSFDPPTYGHLSMAKFALYRMGFDEVWLMPAYRHTFDKQMSDFDHRLKMCYLLSEDDRIVPSDFQKTHDCDSSTLSLFKLLRKKFKKHDFYMIIGSDNANVIHKWINYEELIKKVPFVVMERKGQELNADVTWCLKNPHIYVKNLKAEEISSTIVRNAIKTGEPITKFTNSHIIKYIKKNNLYI